MLLTLNRLYGPVLVCGMPCVYAHAYVIGMIVWLILVFPRYLLFFDAVIS